MRIVIEGAGKIGSYLAKMLNSANNDITVIDKDEERLQGLAASTDVLTLLGRPSSISTLRKAEVGRADLFIAVNPDTKQDINIVSCLISKKLGCQKVCARIDDEDYLSYENKYLFTEMGIDLLFYPERIAAKEIAGQLKHTASSSFLDFARGRLQLSVFRLEEDSPLLDMNLAEFAALVSNDRLQFRVVAISRDNVTIIPKFNSRFQYHDLVFIITTREGVTPMMDFLGEANVEVDKVMILGGSHIGKMVANLISKEVSHVKLLEKDKETCSALRESTADNVTVVNGDGRNSDFLVEERIRDYDAFIAVTGNDEANILSCVAARKFGVRRTMAEVENIEYIRLAEDMGVDTVINKKLITAGKIYKMTLSNKVRFIKYMNDTNAEVLEYIVAPGSRITAGKLKEIDFPENAIIGGVIRGNDSFIAIGDTRIEDYDRVAVFALPDAVREVDRFFK